MILKTLKSNTLKTAFLGSLLVVFFFSFNVSTANASIFDFNDLCDYGCGGYEQSYNSGCDYGCGDYGYSDPCNYGCGYQQPVYVDPCSYGCGYQQPSYQYTQYPYQIYQPVYQPPVQNGGYNYVQYPYPIYHYFQNPTPKASSDVWSTPISTSNTYSQNPMYQRYGTSNGFVRGY
jgi:hypothetical protein